MNRSYPAKVILLGEYSVLTHGQALAVPMSTYTARFTQLDENEDNDLRALMSQYLDPICNSGLLDDQRLRVDFASGRYIDTDIPIGYGLGSSGAFCAAIYDQYAIDKAEDLVELRSDLRALEATFHSTSSGIDPLVSYTDRPILIKDGLVSAVQDLPLDNLYLWDSGLERRSAALIAIHREKLKKGEFWEPWSTAYLPLVESMIGQLSTRGILEKASMQHLSQLQLQLFAEMIPSAVKELWTAGLGLGTYSMKLCGAGGGGFFLVCADHQEAIPDLIPLRQS